MTKVVCSSIFYLHAIDDLIIGEKNSFCDFPNILNMVRTLCGPSILLLFSKQCLVSLTVRWITLFLRRFVCQLEMGDGGLLCKNNCYICSKNEKHLKVVYLLHRRYKCCSRTNVSYFILWPHDIREERW